MAGLWRLSWFFEPSTGFDLWRLDNPPVRSTMCGTNDANAPRGGTDARIDAGVAAAMPQADRPRRTPARRPGGRVAIDRGPDPAHDLCRNPSSVAQGGAAAGA